MNGDTQITSAAPLNISINHAPPTQVELAAEINRLKNYSVIPIFVGFIAFLVMATSISGFMTSLFMPPALMVWLVWIMAVRSFINRTLVAWLSPCIVNQKDWCAAQFAATSNPKVANYLSAIPDKRPLTIFEARMLAVTSA